MRQDNNRGKALAAASYHPVPALQFTYQRVALGLFQAHVAGGCAARGVRWRAGADKIAIMANGGAPNGLFLHCLGDTDGHLMPLSPAVRFRYDSTVQPLYIQLYPTQRSSKFALTYIATCG